MAIWREANAIRNFLLPGAVATLLSGGSLTHISGLTALAAVGIGVDRTTSKKGFQEMGKSRFGALCFGLALPILLASGRALFKGASIAEKIGFGVNAGMGVIATCALPFIYEDEPVIRIAHGLLPSLIALQTWLPPAAGLVVGGLAATAIAKISIDEEHDMDLGALAAGVAALGVAQSGAGIIQGNRYCWGGAVINAGVLAGLGLSIYPKLSKIEMGKIERWDLWNLLFPSLVAIGHIALKDSPIARALIATVMVYSYSITRVFPTDWNNHAWFGIALATLPSAAKGVWNGPGFFRRVGFFAGLGGFPGLLGAIAASWDPVMTRDIGHDEAPNTLRAWGPAIAYFIYSKFEGAHSLIGYGLLAWATFGLSARHYHEENLRAPAVGIALAALAPSVRGLIQEGGGSYIAATALNALLPIWATSSLFEIKEAHQ